MRGDLILDGQKLAWHQDRVKAWLWGERIAPVTIDIALTRRCTYRCVYCYGTLQENEGKPMTREVVLRFMDDAAAIGARAVSLISDGESTCSPHFYAAVLRGKGNGLDIGVATNGYLLDRARLPELLSALTYLRYNISAADPARYAEIHGCRPEAFQRVVETIRESVRIKKENGLPVTIGLQMVLLPEFEDQVLPLTDLGDALGVDYLVLKHCSDDEFGTLGVDYSRYAEMSGLLREAESRSRPGYLVKAKWSKILSEGKRCYRRCYGPPFILQISGTGLVAPCGMLFNSRYARDYHIGNISETPFRQLWQGERYWEVMERIASDRFDPSTMCGCLCLQHKVNEYLWALKEEGEPCTQPEGLIPDHVNFI